MVLGPALKALVVSNITKGVIADIFICYRAQLRKMADDALVAG